MMEFKEFIDSKKVGDEVLVNGKYGEQFVDHIDRFTKTMVVLAVRGRFKRKTGYEVNGDTWFRESIDQASPEEIEKVKAQKLHARAVANMERVDWSKVSLEDMKEIYSKYGLTKKAN